MQIIMQIDDFSGNYTIILKTKKEQPLNREQQLKIQRILGRAIGTIGDYLK